MNVLDSLPRQDGVAVPGSTNLLPSRFAIWCLRSLCAIALCVSGYLAWTAFNSSPVYGCSGEVFNCGHVLTSAWSKWFGIPVGAPAFGLYASLLTALAFLNRPIPQFLVVRSWQLLTAGAVAAGLGALWFIGIQVFVIQHLCVYCLVAHTCGLSLAAYVLWNRPLGNRHTAGLSLAGALGIAVLITGQVLGPAPQTFVVEHFDVPTAPGNSSASTIEDAPLAEPPVEEAPGVDGDNLFAAPSEEVFSAPDVFEAPVIEGSDLTSGVTPEDATEDPKNPEKEESSDITASLLLVLPPFVSRSLQHFVVAGSVSGSEQPDESTDADSDASTETAQNEAVKSEGKETKEVTSDGDTGADVAAGKSDESAATDGTDNTIGTESADKSTSDSAENSTKSAQAADVKPTDEKKSEPAAESEPVKPEPVKPEPRIVGVSGNQFRLNVAQWPLLGKPDAKYIFVEMFDYTCPHCRNTHSAIHGAFQKFGSDLAVVALVVPLHPSCNSAASGGNADACELARLSLGVWRVKPEAFMEYHNWMFSGGRNRTVQEARQQAEKLVGAPALQKELSRKTVSEYISRHVELYRKVGSGSVPKLMFPKSTMTGEVGSVSSLQSAIQREFN